ncbi:DNA-binding protein [Nocardia asteroides]|uniref:DNA-binding protein n=1 Tax=Nocardia asteroides TaxID=1824 RepID=UPI0033EC4223
MICEKCGNEYRPLRRGLCKRCYAKRRDRDIAYGRWARQEVAAEPVREHVRALIAAGMSRRQICERAGLDRKRIAVLLREENPPTFLWPATAEAFLSVPVPETADCAKADHDLVLAIGTQRRLRALVALGWPQRHLAAELGIGARNFTPLIHRAERVTVARHRAVAALFGRLQLEPGPSSRARLYARRRHWALPFQWDEEEIDRPDGRVAVYRRVDRVKRGAA